MNKTELKALIKEAFLTEKKNTLLNENAPGFDNRKQGEALPTLESIKAAYEAKKLEEAVQSTKEEKIKHIESKFGHLDTIRKGKFTVEEENGHFMFIPDSFEELASDNDEEADDQGGSQILKQIEAAINETVEEITTVTKMTKPAEAAEIAKAEGTPKATVDAAIKKAKTSGKDVSIAEDTLEEDKFVDAALEDLRTVINNLAHTSGMGIEEAAEMAMMHIEDMFMGGEEEEDMMQEGTPTVSSADLTVTGNVGLGTTSPTYKLQVKENQPTVFDDKSMDDLLNIILKYVKDPADAEKELERFDAGGFEAMSDSVQANLDRDEEYKAWYNKLHSIKEEEVEEGVEKDYWADYTDIGMFYLDGFGMENTLTDDQFEKLGEKIVKQLYGGDVGKAYDDIVRGKKQRSGTVKEAKMEKELEHIYAREREHKERMRIANELFPEIAKEQEGGKLVNLKPLSNEQRDEVYAEYAKLNESVIAEADMIVESFRTRK